jgi:uncharacterized protein YpmB
MEEERLSDGQIIVIFCIVMAIIETIINYYKKKTKMEKTIKLENYDFITDEILMDDIDLQIIWVENDNVNYEILNINTTDENSVVVNYKLV